MRRASLAQLPCPIARTLDLVGEWWTLLIVRDALFGARRFDEFKTTGIAQNVLTARLKRLVDAGILERRQYQIRPNRLNTCLPIRAVRSLRWLPPCATGELNGPPVRIKAPD